MSPLTVIVPDELKVSDAQVATEMSPLTVIVPDELKVSDAVPATEISLLTVNELGESKARTALSVTAPEPSAGGVGVEFPARNSRPAPVGIATVEDQGSAVRLGQRADAGDGAIEGIGLAIRVYGPAQVACYAAEHDVPAQLIPIVVSRVPPLRVSMPRTGARIVVVADREHPAIDRRPARVGVVGGPAPTCWRRA